MEKTKFIRTATTFRHKISKTGLFKPEKGRYHLYVSYACPWANRTLIFRSLKGLEDVISVSVVNPLVQDAKGWNFKNFLKESCKDHVNGFAYLNEVYRQQDKNYNGRFTVPILYDKKQKLIVNNESSEIIRMLNSEFNEWATKNKTVDYYPKELQSEIEKHNAWIYPQINNGVYKCGFAKGQEAYENAFDGLFSGLEKLEKILDKNRYICGDVFTEADIRCFVTLIRFDLVYYVHFKCNDQMIRDYPNIWGYTQEIYQIEDIKKTIHFDHIKCHYYYSHKSINPNRIIPKGPKLSFEGPHGRDLKFSKK